MYNSEPMKRWRPLSIVVAGGGTGGHLFPGIAVACEFAKRDPHSRVLFVGAGRPFEKEALARAGYLHRTIVVEGFKGRALSGMMRSLVKIPGALRHSIGILSEVGADIVIGVGGYAAGPVALAAWLKGIPVVLCEQNIFPGITNRMLLPIARRIYVSFEDTRGRIDPTKMQFTGNPVRQQILDAAAAGPVTDQSHLTIMVVGGSQGAHAINVALMDALPHIRNKQMIRFIHQTGSADRDQVTAAYGQAGIEAEVKDFFHDMASRYRRADLIVCRAGATTVAELTAMGKAALFIPYPYAADNHQVHNARVLVEKGAAQMVLEHDLSGVDLARRLDHWGARPERLETMAAASRTLGKPDAAKTIVDDCYQLVGNSTCI